MEKRGNKNRKERRRKQEEGRKDKRKREEKRESGASCVPCCRTEQLGQTHDHQRHRVVKTKLPGKALDSQHHV